MVAERAQNSRPTLLRVERGDPGVSLGVYATVLWVLGLGDRVGRLAATETDIVGLILEDERLPQRVSTRRQRSNRLGGEVAAPQVERDADVSGESDPAILDTTVG